MKISPDAKGWLFLAVLGGTALWIPGPLVYVELGALALYGAHEIGKMTGTTEADERNRVERCRERGLCPSCGALIAELTGCGWKNCRSGLPFDPEAKN
jgi:hypothetical protein